MELARNSRAWPGFWAPLITIGEFGETWSGLVSYMWRIGSLVIVSALELRIYLPVWDDGYDRVMYIYTAFSNASHAYD